MILHIFYGINEFIIANAKDFGAIMRFFGWLTFGADSATGALGGLIAAGALYLTISYAAPALVEASASGSGFETGAYSLAAATGPDLGIAPFPVTHESPDSAYRATAQRFAGLLLYLTHGFNIFI